ncbi:SH3 domain-containing protein [Azospirillum rugosum]|uniref:SH3b domain-containing protein n=1 Tax=Azospirillum rugosum TaxID=416170 RepID=A0ABS4SJS4_9PROT|nr:SH3 domain-containing protein [Azospirillum rugosum]MBP2292328.1 hypothetical protein [Azospirillum rugosum]MDQ0526087.1 hypothetical protein [Azospirillum rugosum]
MRFRPIPLPVPALFAGLVLAATAAQAESPATPDRFTPRPPPTAVLPALTPRAAPGKDAPQPHQALRPLPVVSSPLAPLLESFSAPGESPAAPVASAPEVGRPEPTPAAPLPGRKPERVAQAAPAKPSASASFKGYAKASREDRGCALPDDLPETRRAPALSVGAIARVRADANLRVAPFCDAKVKDVLEDGETVTVTGVHGAWVEVSRRGRVLGYVGAALLAAAKTR